MSFAPTTRPTWKPRWPYWLQKQDNQPESGLPLEGIAVRAECTRARLLIQDEDTGRAWTLDPVDISAAVPRDRRTPIQFKLSTVVADDHPSGRLDVELSARLVETKDDRAASPREG